MMFVEPMKTVSDAKATRGKYMTTNYGKIIEDLKAKIISQKAQIQRLAESLKRKDKVIGVLSKDCEFLKERIVTVYGREALKNLLHHVEAPRGFDSKSFDERTEEQKKGTVIKVPVHELKEWKEYYGAESVRDCIIHYIEKAGHGS